MQNNQELVLDLQPLQMAKTNYVIRELKQECEIIKVSNEVGVQKKCIQKLYKECNNSSKTGIQRLILDKRISFTLEEKKFLYAQAYSALGIEQRLQILNDTLEAGCRLPIAVYSEEKTDKYIQKEEFQVLMVVKLQIILIRQDRYCGRKTKVL